MHLGLGARQVQHNPTIWGKRQKFHKSSCFNFSSGFEVLIIFWFFTSLIFWSHLLIKWLEAAIHCCTRRIELSFCKVQRGSLNHKPRKIPLEGSWIIILQNISKCLLLNDKQMPHEILFSLLDEIRNTKQGRSEGTSSVAFEVPIINC